MKQMDKKTLKKVHVWVRAVIQLLYFLFIPSAYTAAFNGVKYIFTQMGAKSHLELTSFVVTLIALCLFTVVFGRFFCGFACAFGSLGDAVRAFYLQETEKETGDDESIGGKISAGSEVCCAGASGSKLLYRSIQ